MAKISGISRLAITVSLGVLLSFGSACAGDVGDAAAGQKTAQVCKSCHTFEKGGPARVGPNLWGIYGRSVAKSPGYTYSPAMAKKGGVWNDATLDAFLENPKTAVPGNKMVYAGVKTPKDRANLIAWFKTLK